MEHNWLTSIWKLTNQLQILVEVEKHWTLLPARTNDRFLMDQIIKYNFSPLQLRHINYCRLFLQVFLLSDFTTADGQKILPYIIKGFQPVDRKSGLHWPRQELPPEQAWAPWRLALEHLSPGTKLVPPLRPWLRPPHQKWK
jgi:hypothetical protein